jgi:hypothetical protein
MSQPNAHYTFVPKEDITAYQLAQLLPVLIASGKKEASIYDLIRGIKICVEGNPTIDKLEPDLRKHFKPDP